MPLISSIRTGIEDKNKHRPLHVQLETCADVRTPVYFS
jgi:hypothetical protein